MEDRMDGAHRVQQLQCDRMQARACYNLVWPKVFLSELFGQMSRPEKLSLDKGLLADLKLWWRDLASISGVLVLGLSFGDVLAKFLVELVKVNHEVLCSQGGEVLLRMNSKIWVIAFVGKERQNADGHTWGIVVGILGEWEEF